MKFSACNIAWKEEQDDEMYHFLEESGFSGVEIAPTRIFPSTPYSKLDEARKWREDLASEYHLAVPSIQSIWYGQKGNLFLASDREQLIQYTDQAAGFAQAVGASNMVFGNPAARRVPLEMNPEDADAAAVSFFRRIGESAINHGTIVAIEPTPVIYGTNFLNRVGDTIAFLRRVNHPGVRMNLDIGTIIYNDSDRADVSEQAGQVLREAIPFANHVHISEPGLDPIQPHPIHRLLLQLLKEYGYDGYVSIEMGRTGNLADIKTAVKYLLTVYASI